MSTGKENEFNFWFSLRVNLKVCVMNETTWFEYFNGLYEHFSPEVRKRLFQEISRPTISRWVKGTYLPKSTKMIHKLLDVIPDVEQRKTLLTLMHSDPTLHAMLINASDDSGDVQEHEDADDQYVIPSSLYASVLHTWRTTSDSRTVRSSTILLYALDHLAMFVDASTNLEIIVTRCMPPRNGRVRSLYCAAYVKKRTFKTDSIERLFGFESLPGRVVMTGRPDTEMGKSGGTASVPFLEADELSGGNASAFPLMREGGIAGAMIVSGSGDMVFTREMIALLELYADLLSTVFGDSDFVTSESIELSVMPAWKRQRDVWATFSRRVASDHRSQLEREVASYSLKESEMRVRQAIEEEFLLMNASLPSPSTVHVS